MFSIPSALEPKTPTLLEQDKSMKMEPATTIIGDAEINLRLRIFIWLGVVRANIGDNLALGANIGDTYL
jgi:hypothetical protein